VLQKLALAWMLLCASLAPAETRKIVVLGMPPEHIAELQSVSPDARIVAVDEDSLPGEVANADANPRRDQPRNPGEEWKRGGFHPIELRGETAVIMGVGGCGADLGRPSFSVVCPTFVSLQTTQNDRP